MWNRLGFRDRLQLIGFGLMVLMLLAVAGGASTLVDHHLRVELQARAQQMAPLFNAALGAPMAQRDYASVAAIVEEIRGSRELVYVDVLDTAGRSITAQRAAASAEGQPKLSDDTLPFSTPLELGGQRLGSVEFGLSREAIDKTRHSILVGISLLSAAALAVFSVAVALLGTAVTRPLKALITAARDIQSGHYEVDLDTTRKDEFGVLMKTFGKMTQEIRRKVSELIQSEGLQRRYLQESTTALQEAQAANRVKAEFIANMSHEIRTPMNSIMGYADLLRLTPLGPQQAAYVTRLHESGGAMLALINDILDFSRIEAGQLKSGTESFSLPPLIETVCGLFMPALSEKGLVLQSSIDPEIPADLQADRQRLQQVLLNLLGNAVKFTLRGQINVEVKRVQAPANKPPTGTQPLWLRIAVRDTGIGIAPEQLEQVFQPFAQADGSITRRFGGTGLGLSISRSLSELMGGHLGVQSELGVGSEFAIVFPCTPAPGSERTQPDTEGVVADQMADAGRSPFALALDAPPDGRAPAQTAAPVAPSTTAHPMSAAQQTSGLGPAKRQALQPPLLELEQALEGKMMRARQLAEDIAAGLQDTAAAQAFAPVLADTQRLRFNQARDRLRAFSHWLQSP
jgi:signal transduction histidine kinase